MAANCTLSLLFAMLLVLALLLPLAAPAMAQRGPVIVGGSAGSGTRSVARMMMLSGVHMVVHSPQTMDAERGVDWIGLERMVLEHTRTMAWTLDDLPPEVSTHVLTALDKALRAWRAEAAEWTSKATGRKRTWWGFKAPCALVFQPVWKRLCGPDLRIVQVVRDGRDLVFSGNQNDVARYSPYLGLHTTIRLWAANNVQWRNARWNMPEGTHAIVHAEHMLDVDSAARVVMDVSTRLLWEEALDACCVARELAEPLGSHDGKASRGGRRSMGKWQRLASQTQLWSWANDPLVAYALREFDSDTRSEPFCTNTSACTLPFPPAYAVDVPVLSDCVFRRYAWYKGGTDVGSAKVPSLDACCALCWKRSGCRAFEYVHLDGMCWLKGSLPEPGEVAPHDLMSVGVRV